MNLDYSPIVDAGGGVGGVIAIVVETTAKVRVEAERALREREEKFRTFAEAMPNQVWTATKDGKLGWFNTHVHAYSGCGHEGLAGIAWTATVHPGDLPAAQKRWALAVASGAPYDAEFRLRRADGTWRWHLSRDIMLVASFDGIVEAVSPSFGSLQGWSEHDIVGHNFLQLVHPDDQAATSRPTANRRSRSAARNWHCGSRRKWRRSAS